MLIISKKQMDALIGYKVSKFSDKLTQIVMNIASIAALFDGENNLKAEVNSMIDYCLKNKIRLESDIEEFILGCLLNKWTVVKLVQSDKVTEILTYPDRRPADKLYHLFTYMDRMREEP